MRPDLTMALLIAATAVTGLLAGASLDQSIKQLPARHGIGAAAYSRYSQAADLGNGIAFYGTLVAAVLLLNVGAAFAAYLRQVSGASAPVIYACALLAVLHSVVTGFAAPTNFAQRRATDETELTAILDRFTQLQTLRCVLQVANFGADLWALALVAAR